MIEMTNLSMKSPVGCVSRRFSTKSCSKVISILKMMKKRLNWSDSVLRIHSITYKFLLLLLVNSPDASRKLSVNFSDIRSIP